MEAKKGERTGGQEETETRDSVSLIIIGINKRVRDEYEILKIILKLYGISIISLVSPILDKYILKGF